MDSRNTKDDSLPLSRPVLGADGSTWLNSLPLRKGTTLLIALEAANRNPDLWGLDAGEWRPERWLSPLPRAAEDPGLPSIYSHMYALIQSSDNALGLLKLIPLQCDILRWESVVHVCIFHISSNPARNADSFLLHQRLQVRRIGNESVFCPFRFSDLTTYTTNSRNSPEVVLSTLVRNFRFELPVDKKLAWKLGGIVSPGVENDPIPKLPLRVSRV